MDTPVVLPVFVHSVPNWQGFIFATIAPVGAVLFTNPLDTAKVRLQLQNRTKVQVYRNSFDCIAKILKSEGIRGIQKGLTPAIFRESSKNIFRIGLFDPILNYLHDKKKEKTIAPLWKRIVASATTGAMGAVSCNPFELIKTRLQAQTQSTTMAIGHQHNYSGMLSAFSDILKKDGPAGLYKGSGLSVVRGIFGTAANLTTYSLLRDYILANNILPDSPWTDALCSCTSSFVAVSLMNPVDVVRTRVYNQPSLPAGASAVTNNSYYHGGIDAMVKIVKYEGVGALYKGFTTNFMRLAPHFTLTFLFLEQMRRMSIRHSNRNYQNDFDEKLKKLYGIYGRTSFEEASLIEVLHTGMPYTSKMLIESVVREQNFITDQPFEFQQFADVVASINKMAE